MVALLLLPVLLANKHAFSAYPRECKPKTVPKSNAGELPIYYWKHALNGRRSLSSDDKTLPATCRFAFERKYCLFP